jgi:hypothetical protein
MVGIGLQVHALATAVLVVAPAWIQLDGGVPLIRSWF